MLWLGGSESIETKYQTAFLWRVRHNLLAARGFHRDSRDGLYDGLSKFHFWKSQYEEISFIPVLIGMFALGEIIRTVLGSNNRAVDQAARSRVGFTAVLQACRNHWQHGSDTLLSPGD